MRALLLLALIGAALAALDASTNTPGGIPRGSTPQFVLLTHDDAITSRTYDAMRSVTDGVEANGCPATATMFVTSTGTDCELLVDLYRSGYEIGDHTISHKSFLTQSFSSLENEILGARDRIAECGIPESAIQGLRSPFLEIKGEVWEILADNGFLYDSTLIENTQGNSVSEDFSVRTWPWDMANGFPINCGWYSNIQKCPAGGRYPGLWQVPLWDLSAKGGPYTMDYGDDGSQKCSGANCVYDILMANFQESYEGNRAPFPIFIHTPWLSRGSHLQQLQRFVKEIAQLEGVYFVTMRQLLAWVQNPVPLEDLTPQRLGCGNEGGAPGSADAASSGGKGGAQQQQQDEEPPADDTGIDYSDDEAAGNEARVVSPLVNAAPGAAAPAPAPSADDQYGWAGEGGGDGGVQQMQAPDLAELSAMMQRSQ